MEIMLRATAIFVFVFALTRAMGKKELTQLSAFELILLITMGDLVQQGVTQEDMSVTGAMLAVGTIGALIALLSVVGYRWRGTRTAIEGLAVVVVREGEPIRQAMQIERLTMEELVEAARHAGISNLSEVRIGVLEPDGRFSFITFESGDQQGGQEEKPVR